MSLTYSYKPSRERRHRLTLGVRSKTARYVDFERSFFHFSRAARLFLGK